MKEEFLHYLWKYRLYDPCSLTDYEGNRIEVLNPGLYNRDAGPDFFNAMIKIGGTLWAGNVEIHLRSSHFSLHGHNSDPAYDNVILHLVAENDRKVFNSKGEEILTCKLAFGPDLYERYLDLVNNPVIIACQSKIKNLDYTFIRQWLYALAVERLVEKSEQILHIFSETDNDWEETFYRLLTRYFGFRVNTEPFGMLANALPFRIIRKHADNRFQVEAMLFGASGFLDEGLFRDAINDKYYTDLLKEYRILSSKYSLQSVHGWLWKFARLRPANFPTIRLSQLAEMLTVTGGLFSKVMESENINELKSLFVVSASGYWDDHFVFGRKSRKYVKVTGSQATDIFLINAVIPVIFVYGKSRDSSDLCDKAISFLEEIGPEKNKIIAEWKEAGVDATSSFDTQALIHLRNNYCTKRRCLECRIGAGIISTGSSLRNQEELMLEP